MREEKREKRDGEFSLRRENETRNRPLFRFLTTGLLFLLVGALAVGLTMYLKSGRLMKSKQENCAHELWKNGECVYCGYRCPHESWEEGRCVRCGYECGHAWKDGVCTICGLECGHPAFVDGACEVCGFQCPGHEFENGVCKLCGIACEHEWEDGVCRKCQMVCTHESHDKETRKCTECGKITHHSFVNGVCECGAEPAFYDGRLPEEYYEPCEHAGTVEKAEYSLEPGGYWETEVRKTMNVYLPYGYDAQKAYDVLILIHGGWETEDALITREYDYGFNLVMKNVYDQMMDRGICEPMILVFPTSYNGENYTLDSSYGSLAAELTETILPYVAEHYSTYAASGKIRDLQEARMHFGIGGVSNGSLFALHSGMLLNYDLFGSYVCLSGNNLAPGEIDEFVQNTQKDLPFGYFFAGAGSYDDQRDNARQGYQMLVEKSGKLTEGKNAMYLEVEGEHEIAVWCTEFFNAMQVLFES